MSENPPERPEVSERVIRTIRTRSQARTGPGPLSGHTTQSRVLVYFQGAVCLAVLVRGLWQGPLTLTVVPVVVAMIPAYLLLARMAVRLAWTGAGRAALVVAATLWVAWQHLGGFALARFYDGVELSDPEYAPLAQSMLVAVFLWTMGVMPALILGALYLLLPKDDAA